MTSMTSDPEDPYGLAGFIEGMPPGFLVSRPVFNEFLKPPSNPDAWFCSKVWQVAEPLLDGDPAVTRAEYNQAAKLFNVNLGNMVWWAGERSGLSNPANDRLWSVGKDLLRNIESSTRQLEGLLGDSGAAPALAADTSNAVHNLISVLWEYYQCVLFVMEAVLAGTTPMDIRDQAWREMPHPWEAGVTPSNLESGGIFIPARPIPMPSLPQIPGEGQISSGEGTSVGQISSGEGTGMGQISSGEGTGMGQISSGEGTSVGQISISEGTSRSGRTGPGEGLTSPPGGEFEGSGFLEDGGDGI